MSVTIGADPEFFLYDLREDGVIPSVGIVPGTKEKPHEFGDGTFCHEDNVCIEVGFAPVSSGSAFARSMSTVRENVQSNFLNSRQQLYVMPSIDFLEQQLTSKQAQRFGCDPDFDAYTGGRAPRDVPRSLTGGTTRYAGGHVHVGGEFNCPPFVAALYADLFLSLGILANGFGRESRASRKRREYYGQPGVFRPKPYGIEYRTLSNGWCYNQNATTWMGRQAMSLGIFLENTSATRLRSLLKEIPWSEVRAVLSDTESPIVMSSVNELYYRVQSLGVDI